jgi:hypothetical protein
MPRAGFEPTIPVFKCEKTFHALGYEHAEWITHHSALITQEANQTNLILEGGAK